MIPVLARMLAAFAQEGGGPPRWAGVDETVVERFAAEAGRLPWHPIPEASGDLHLFLFLVAGIVGGFAAGYLYRRLFVEEAHPRPEERP